MDNLPEYLRHYNKPVTINNLFRFSKEARKSFPTILSHFAPLPPSKASCPMATRNIAPVSK
jgi:hypothetical protein